jgi:hypothetical protein
MKQVALALLLIASAALTYLVAAKPKLGQRIVEISYTIPERIFAGASLIATKKDLHFSSIDKHIPGAWCSTSGGFTYDDNFKVKNGEFLYGKILEAKLNENGAVVCEHGLARTRIRIETYHCRFLVNRGLNRPISVEWIFGMAEFYVSAQTEILFTLDWGNLKVKLPTNAVFRLHRYDPKILSFVFDSPGIEFTALPFANIGNLASTKLEIVNLRVDYSFALQKEEMKKRKTPLRYTPSTGIEERPPAKITSVEGFKKTI